MQPLSRCLLRCECLAVLPHMFATLLNLSHSASQVFPRVFVPDKFANYCKTGTCTCNLSTLGRVFRSAHAAEVKFPISKICRNRNHRICKTTKRSRQRKQRILTQQVANNKESYRTRTPTSTR